MLWLGIVLPCYPLPVKSGEMRIFAAVCPSDCKCVAFWLVVLRLSCLVGSSFPAYCHFLDCSLGI